MERLSAKEDGTLGPDRACTKGAGALGASTTAVRESGSRHSVLALGAADVGEHKGSVRGNEIRFALLCMSKSR